MDPDDALRRLATGDHAACIAHVERIPARGPLPDPGIEFAPEIAARLRRAGIGALWSHQADGVRAARAGRNVAISTGTASGKSLVYQMATFERFLADPKATALYLFPTKALAQDQLRHLREFALPQVRAAVYDGDTPSSERQWIRRNANLIVTNPDMLHVGIMPRSDQWAVFLRHLNVVVVDEMHTLRGVFGSHVANVLRRIRRLAARYGARPLFVCASATIGNPGELASRLTGLDFEEITTDGSPRGERVFAFWEPPFIDDSQLARYSATSQAAGLLAGLVEQGVRTIAFSRSRKGAELVAQHARDLLGRERAPAVAAYRAGYLAEERRDLERRFVDGTLTGIAATNALELGIDIGGLDACVLAGYPGTIAATWQQAGRAGRTRDAALSVLVAQDDPLDQYVIHHPEHVFGRPHEAAVIDHANPHILDAHIGCAAFELPLGDADAEVFGEGFEDAVARLVERGMLRARGDKWFWAGRAAPAQSVDIRSAGSVVNIVEEGTGRLLGTGEGSRAPHTVHPGAIYLHQGEQFEVRSLDLERGVAIVMPSDATWYTQARDVTDIRIRAVAEKKEAGRTTLCLGDVEVSDQVVSYVRKRLYTNETLDEVPLDMPAQSLRTKAVWYTVPEDVLLEAGLAFADVPGAAHAAEHCAIGIMPLFAMCDRWDIGGVSTALHEDTGMCTVFIYDGYPGGAGFAARSFVAGTEHLRATLDTIEECTCERGCPGCVQSPKCGNGNEPLDKGGAARMLRAILGLSPRGSSARGGAPARRSSRAPRPSR